MTNLEIKDFVELIENGNQDLLNHMISKENLVDDQFDTILNCLKSSTGKLIISDEMGLGKTFICMGLVRIASLLYPDKKIIISVPKSVAPNFEKLIKESLGLKCIIVSGDVRDLEKLEKEYNSTQVIIAQHSFWTHTIGGQIFIYNYYKDFSMSFFDEAGYKNSGGYDLFKEFSREIPLSFVANATPIDEGTEKIYNLLYACNALDMKKNSFEYRYSDPIIKRKVIQGRFVKVDKILQDFGNFITVKNRKEIGIETKVNINFHKINTFSIQDQWLEMGMTKQYALYSPETYSGEGIYNAYFSEKTVASVNKVLKLLEEFDEKVIIYVKNTSAIVSFKELLEDKGYNVYIIDGKHTKTKELVSEQENLFNSDPKGILLTNIEKGINLGTCDRIIVYNNPPDLQQLIYRMVRGFVSKSVKVEWIYYLGKEEKQIENILNKTRNVSNLLKRELDVISQIEDELKMNSGKDDGKKTYVDHLDRFFNEEYNK